MIIIGVMALIAILLKLNQELRGSGDNKVLRTIKINAYQGKSMFGNGGGNIWDYFCNHRLFNGFLFLNILRLLSTLHQDENH